MHVIFLDFFTIPKANQRFYIIESIEIVASILLNDGSDVDAIAISIRKGQDLEVGIRLSDLFEPLITSTTRSEGIHVIRRVNNDSPLGLATASSSPERWAEGGIGIELDLSHGRSWR